MFEDVNGFLTLTLRTGTQSTLGTGGTITGLSRSGAVDEIGRMVGLNKEGTEAEHLSMSNLFGSMNGRHEP